ncbi:tyrosine-protein phosphatase [Caulobacter sp. 17J65-9]|uniref:tyrosine-protein phosphatase n=1 Tax=Caulobacter sp. 17J65-9 TaxID=2709382 RepID=UPI0013C7B226|nr:tyrosine-protein phosphatase [Caulobacter sp. 17J65-9]NEX93717.1 tyrosine-protein phosphatase [Caulobacter sp. 17J65-9]
MSTRLLGFEAVENFRDYGDYATAAGRRLVQRRLLRSGHHARASDADLAAFSALGVDVVVDLRRASERAAQPSRRPQGFAGRVIESRDADLGEAPHIAFLRSTDLTPDSVRGFMTETYRNMPFDARHVDLFTRYFAALAETEGAVLIHCAAGKDRTGLLAALTHHLAGVGEADALEDYLLTNTAVNLEARAPEVAAVIERNFGRRPSDAATRAFLGVEAEYLAAAFAAVRERHGSLDAYLRDVLGVGPELRARIEARLCG